MDLSIYRKEAEKNKLLLEEKSKKEEAILKQKEEEEKLAAQQKIENRALEIFNNIPNDCEAAAKKGEFKAYIFTIDCDEDNADKSDRCKIRKHLLKLLNDDNITYKKEYRFVKDDGYGEDYIKHDDTYYDYVVEF